MGVMNLRDFPNDLQKALRIKALEQDVTLKELVIRYCQEGLERDREKKAEKKRG